MPWNKFTGLFQHNLMTFLVSLCNYFPFAHLISQESKKHNLQLHLTNVALFRRRHREEGRRGREPLAGEERRMKEKWFRSDNFEFPANAKEKPGRKKERLRKSDEAVNNTIENGRSDSVNWWKRFSWAAGSDSTVARRPFLLKWAT